MLHDRIVACPSDVVRIVADVAAQRATRTFVLHGLYGASGPWLWGEADPVPVRRGRGRAHPFAASAEELDRILEASTVQPRARHATGETGEIQHDTADGRRGQGSGGPAAISSRRTSFAEVVLPSSGPEPLASPDLAALLAEDSGRERTASGSARAVLTASSAAGSAVLGRWRVPVRQAWTGWGPALPTSESGSDWRPGPGLRYLALVGEFAADLVARGHLLPDVQVDPGRPQARWRPLLAGSDVARYDALRDAMPAAFRATPPVGAGRDETVGVDADTALRETLGALVDLEARRRLVAAGWRPAVARTAGAAGRWVCALGGEARFSGPSAATQELAGQVSAWRARATSMAAATVHLCLRLHEPADAGDATSRWRVEFLLRPAADPSLLVGAAQVWEGRADRLPVWPGHPQDLLLAGLGRAAGVWPPLRRALDQARPTGVDLDVAEAYAFLQAATELTGAGIVVLVPTAWRRNAAMGFTLSVRAANPVVASVRDTAMSLDEMVDFRWEVSLGGQRLSRAEFAELAAAKVPLVQVRGRWARIDPAMLAAGLARTGSGRMSVRAALRHAGLTAAGPAPPIWPDDLEVDLDADGWLATLLTAPGADRIATDGGPDDAAHADLVEFIEAPAGLTVALRPYQRRGLAWLAFLDRVGIGALLADDMGLGKTIQVLALELHVRAGGPRPPTLIICPTSVVGHWAAEARRAAPDLRVLVHHAADRATGTSLAALVAKHDLVVTTYAVLRRDAAGLAALPWDRIVLDEAQQIRNSGTQVARAVRALPARHRVALTGTPVENRLADLWSIMHFLSPGLLGSASGFRARYAVPIERYGDTEATARLRRRIRPVLLRRVKTNPAVLAELPPKIERRELCPLTPEQASLYRAVLDDMLDRLNDYSAVRRRGAVLAAMTRLKQVCNHPAHLLGDGSPLAGRSGKLTRVEQVLAQIVDDGDRALCFTQYTRFGALLEPYLRDMFGVDVMFLHGGTARRDRDAMVERFQSGHGPGIFLLSLRAGGTGLNLTAASHVLHLDRWWNPATQAQATDRAHRIGQRRGVQVRTFVCMGTLEERVETMLADKTLLARTMIGDGESWLATLSTGELRDLFTLTSTPVES